MHTVPCFRSVALENISSAVAVIAIVATAAWLSGCGGGPGGSALKDGIGSTTANDNLSATTTPAGPSLACAAPAEGCPCDREQATATCPGPTVHTGNYTSCAPGARLCSGGTWGPCVSRTVYQSAGTLTQDYASPCPPGTRVRWGALTIEGITPDESRIDVGAQTADTTAQLASAASVRLGQFDGPHESSWTSDDVDVALAARGQPPAAFLRVTVELVPSSSGGATPTVVEWRQASSCVSTGDR